MAKNFYKSLMMSEDVQSMLFTGIFVDGEGKEAECHNGAIVVKGAMADHGVYAGLKDPNVFKIAAPAADTDKLCVVDYVDARKIVVKTVGGKDEYFLANFELSKEFN